MMTTGQKWEPGMLRPRQPVDRRDFGWGDIGWREFYAALRDEARRNREIAMQIERGLIGSGIENRFTEPVIDDLPRWIRMRLARQSRQ